MRKLDPTELRFTLKFGLQKLPRSVLADLAGSDARRSPALDRAVDVLMERFARLEVMAPDTEPVPRDMTKPAG